MSLLFGLMCIALTLNAAEADEPEYITDDFIDFINKNQSLWRAGRNFPEYWSIADMAFLAGTRTGNLPDDNDLDEPPHYDDDIVLPNIFDARIQWPQCSVLRDIRDQGACSSCWAVATAAAMSDRICIASKGNVTNYFSEEDLLSCCSNCGSGCPGDGLLSQAWAFAKGKGVVSGGKYESKEGCRPYTISPCDHREDDALKPCGSGLSTWTPICADICQPSYITSYHQDKKMCKKAFKVPTKNALKEIFHRGSITASMTVYADFLAYKSGVYRHVKGKKVRGHAVKIIGWGVENGVDYWLAANSWNTLWGDQGFFKIVRGKNHCDIEENMVAGFM